MLPSTSLHNLALCCKGNRLPMELCQGYTLDLAPPRAPILGAAEEASTSGHSQAEKYEGPSLLGSTYLAAQVHCTNVAIAQSACNSAVCTVQQSRVKSITHEEPCSPKGKQCSISL